MQETPSKIVPATLASRILRVKSRWLVEEAEAGRLPGLNAGGTWLFNLRSLERALADRVRHAEREGGAL